MTPKILKEYLGGERKDTLNIDEIAMKIAFICSKVLVSKFGINGATFACTTTLAIQFIMYSITTKIIMNKVEKLS